jgi:ferritin-like metal-binding protein YciE
MPAVTLQDLYARKLQDLHSAERQILEALPLMIEQARAPELRRGFELHLAQTEEQARRIEQLFAAHGGGPGERSLALEGIVRQNMRDLEQIEDADARDAALIAGAQAVEHYEIAGYGTARTWAQQLGRHDEARLLEQTLREEEQTDRLLTQVAESLVNRQAATGDRVVERPSAHGAPHGDAFGTSPMTDRDRQLLEEQRRPDARG